MSTILSVHRLTKLFGSTPAVDEISFAVEKGEIMGMLGPNGAGKTTAIRMIMGIISPTSGEISYHFNHNNRLSKQAIGYLPEERGLYNDAKVLETLVYLAELKGVPRSQARKLALEGLRQVDLNEYAYSKLEKLSKGMQQKVQFLAAVLHQPELVVLDEPFSGLDPLNQEVFLNMIRQLQNQGITVLLSSHQMNLVEELCDRIYMINRGRQVLYGNLEEIKNNYGGNRVEIRFLPGKGDPRSIKNAALLRYNSGWAQYHLSDQNQISRFAQEAASQFDLLELKSISPPLHDIFIGIVQERGENVEHN